MNRKVKQKIIMFVGKVSDDARQQMTEWYTRNGVPPIIVLFDQDENHRRWNKILYLADQLEYDEDEISEEMISDGVIRSAAEGVLRESLGSVRIKQIHIVVYPEDASNDWVWLRSFLSKRVVEYVARSYDDNSGRIFFDRQQAGVRVL